MARRSILFGTAFLIAALGATMVLLYVQGIETRATAGQDQVEVLVATEVIEAGESVADAQAAGKLAKDEVLRDDLVDGALASSTSIDDEVALAAVYPGQQIIGQQFGAPGSGETLTIPEDRLAISVELHRPGPGRRLRGSRLAGGDLRLRRPRVYKPDGTTQKLAPYTRLLLPEVEVIGVGATSMAALTTTTEEGEQTTEQIHGPSSRSRSTRSRPSGSSTPRATATCPSPCAPRRRR